MLRRLVACVRELTERVFDFSTARSCAQAQRHRRQDHTYREQVTRELTAMAKRGLVQRAAGALVIPDVQRLERLVVEVRRSA